MAEKGSEITLFLCGDVMTGRGVDQILPHPCAPQLFEAWARSARDYVTLAERAHGPVARPVPDGYLWNYALQVVQRLQPRLSIINHETAVTGGGAPWPGKGIHYRMHPANLSALKALGPDCCVLANNHVLDWGYLRPARHAAGAPCRRHCHRRRRPRPGGGEGAGTVGTRGRGGPAGVRLGHGRQRHAL